MLYQYSHKRDKDTAAIQDLVLTALHPTKETGTLEIMRTDPGKTPSLVS